MDKIKIVTKDGTNNEEFIYDAVIEESEFLKITYQEENNQVNTTVLLKDNELSITKTGLNESEMTFLLGKKTSGFTKYDNYTLDFYILTKEFLIVSGIIYLIYDIIFSDEVYQREIIIYY